jgi:hypothetical protein
MLSLSLAGGILLACNLTPAGPAAPASPRASAPPASPSALPTSGVQPTPGATAYPAPDLTAHPLVWFAPLPPMTTGPGRPFIGSQDFMDLFIPDAAWGESASHIQVFKLYGEWVAYNASDGQLKQVVDDLRRRGMALAVEAGALDAPSDCGQNVEGFAGLAEGNLIADRIQQAGGRIDVIALDEPYFFAHAYDGPNACHWPAEQIARGVDAYIQAMRARFPQVIVGDTEPFAGTTTPEEYRDWLTTFRSLAGYDLAFLHMDMDWSRSDWSQEALRMEGYGRDLGIPIGMIYIGNGADPDDATYAAVTGERILRHQFEDGGQPDQILFQSWVDHPDFVLPETDPTTFTGLIRTYFTAPDQLGFATSGAGANLALHKAVRVSAIEPGHPGDDAVDGDTGTHWSAGNGPPQWIEIDLGAAYAIGEIRLTPSQYPAGRTVHRVLGKGPGTGGEFLLLHTFEGLTEDGQRMIFTPDTPWQGIQVVRVMTDVSPSWVAWREIELIDAGDGP